MKNLFGKTIFQSKHYYQNTVPMTSHHKKDKHHKGEQGTFDLRILICNLKIATESNCNYNRISII